MEYWKLQADLSLHQIILGTLSRFFYRVRVVNMESPGVAAVGEAVEAVAAVEAAEAEGDGLKQVDYKADLELVAKMRDH